jgi:hypothetical protein
VIEFFAKKSFIADMNRTGRKAIIMDPRIPLHREQLWR